MKPRSPNTPAHRATSPDSGDATWETAQRFAAQGGWSADEYLTIPSNRLIEFNEGTIEVLAPPTMTHQLILMFLIIDAMRAVVRPAKLGVALIAPFPIRLSAEKFRQPDVMFMRNEHKPRMSDRFWDGADLVMEVVSDDDRRRDLVTKRAEYAHAGIPEYWIVDPKYRTISVLRLDGRHYAMHGEFAAGQHATSVSLEGFAVDVAAVFAAGDER